MPTIFDGIPVKTGFELAFDQNIETLTLDQLWWLVRFAKHIRGNCKNNKLFNEYMNRNFPNANFREVDKVDGDLFPYKGLEIRLKLNQTYEPSIEEIKDYLKQGVEFEGFENYAEQL